MTFIFRNRIIFGTSQNKIKDKQTEMKKIKNKQYFLKFIWNGLEPNGHITLISSIFNDMGKVITLTDNFIVCKCKK